MNYILKYHVINEYITSSTWHKNTTHSTSNCQVLNCTISCSNCTIPSSISFSNSQGVISTIKNSSICNH
ncbi:MAG: hypothetical protein IIV55_00295 [Alistipes sp.]|nr:hypothetical protein [Alistipes sp.]